MSVQSFQICPSLKHSNVHSDRIADSRHLRLRWSHILGVIIAHLCHTAISSKEGAAGEVDKAWSDLDVGDAERVVCWGIGC